MPLVPVDVNANQATKAYAPPKGHKFVDGLWSEDEIAAFHAAFERHGRDWAAVCEEMGWTRSIQNVKSKAQRLLIMWYKEGKEVPPAVARTGAGHTLSGNALDPNSAAALRVLQPPGWRKIEAIRRAESGRAPRGSSSQSGRRRHSSGGRTKRRRRRDDDDDDDDDEPSDFDSWPFDVAGDTEEVPIVKQQVKRARGAPRALVEYYDRSWEDEAAALSDTVSATTAVQSTSSTRTPLPVAMAQYPTSPSGSAAPIGPGVNKETHEMLEGAVELAAAARRTRLRRRERARYAALQDFTSFCATVAKARLKRNAEADKAGKIINQPPHTFEPALGSQGTIVYVWRRMLTKTVALGIAATKKYPHVQSMHRVLKDIRGHEPSDESPKPAPPSSHLRRALHLAEYAPSLVSPEAVQLVTEAAAAAPASITRTPTALAAYLGDQHSLSRRERFVAACILRDSQPKATWPFLGPLPPQQQQQQPLSPSSADEAPQQQQRQAEKEEEEEEARPTRPSTMPPPAVAVTSTR